MFTWGFFAALLSLLLLKSEDGGYTKEFRVQSFGSKLRDVGFSIT